MLRGGSMSSSHEKMIASTRSNTSPTRRYPDVGFRVARRISPSDTKP
jgi:formylglycine-generating enzyme required for sulfatase activity